MSLYLVSEHRLIAGREADYLRAVRHILFLRFDVYAALPLYRLAVHHQDPRHIITLARLRSKEEVVQIDYLLNEEYWEIFRELVEPGSRRAGWFVPRRDIDNFAVRPDLVAVSRRQAEAATLERLLDYYLHLQQHCIKLPGVAACRLLVSEERPPEVVFVVEYTSAVKELLSHEIKAFRERWGLAPATSFLGTIHLFGELAAAPPPEPI
jgi:hypothetical protein